MAICCVLECYRDLLFQFDIFPSGGIHGNKRGLNCYGDFELEYRNGDSSWFVKALDKLVDNLDEYLCVAPAVQDGRVRDF